MIPSLAILPAASALCLASTAAALARTDVDDIRGRLLTAANDDDLTGDYLRRTEIIISQQGKARAMQQVLSLLFRLSPDGEASISDIARTLDQERASRTAAQLSFVLFCDLDGDGTLQRLEREQVTGAERIQIESFRLRPTAT